MSTERNGDLSDTVRDRAGQKMDREDADTGGPDREGISYPTVNADTDKLDGLSPEIHRTLRMIMGFS
ncbi:MAG TPA: hypothetical protein PLG59_18735, partial [bacterium]|nr:hypothetical protein [bacterium]